MRFSFSFSFPNSATDDAELMCCLWCWTQSSICEWHLILWPTDVWVRVTELHLLTLLPCIALTGRLFWQPFTSKERWRKENQWHERLRQWCPGRTVLYCVVSIWYCHWNEVVSNLSVERAELHPSQPDATGKTPLYLGALTAQQPAYLPVSVACLKTTPISVRRHHTACLGQTN